PPAPHHSTSHCPPAPRASTTAARSRSTTVVPDTAPPKQPAPDAPAHRQQTASAPRQGRGR
ncbi:hypothetical protein QPM16_00235, partial [Streptomyces anulatus]